MTSLVVAIAGGSGAGKTTLANLLAEREPERYAVVRLDDYFKRREELTPIDGVYNWERPESIHYDRLKADLEALKAGHAVTVRTRVWEYNAEHQKVTEKNLAYTIEPKPVVLVEGFLTLHDPAVRAIFDFSIYLDMPIERSLERRLKTQNKYNAADYLENILIPAHREFVEPTKQRADMVVEVTDLSSEEVYARVRARIEEKL